MFTSLSHPRFVAFRCLKLAGFAAVATLLASPATGGVVYTGSSVVFSGSNTAGLSARATFTVDTMNSNVLRLLLENTSSGSTAAPSALLTSAYFNVLSGTLVGTPAPLTYQSASGSVFRALKNQPDAAVVYHPPIPPSTTGSTSAPPPPVPPSNLKAINKGDDTWQFRDVFSLVTSQPPLKFGVGTVGNSSLGPDNNFKGDIVGGFDFGIYTGDVATQNLDGTLLVRNSALFEFAGFSGFHLSQVSPHMVFGFGTKPDFLVTVPEPGAASLAALGLAATLVTARRLRCGPPESRRPGPAA